MSHIKSPARNQGNSKLLFTNHPSPAQYLLEGSAGDVSLVLIQETTPFTRLMSQRVRFPRVLNPVLCEMLQALWEAVKGY